jgi:hypothetical protein
MKHIGVRLMGQDGMTREARVYPFPCRRYNRHRATFSTVHSPGKSSQDELTRLRNMMTPEDWKVVALANHTSLCGSEPAGHTK